MAHKNYEIQGVRVIDCASDLPLKSERDATDLIGEALGRAASTVVVNTAQLGDDFFDLSTCLAGSIVQKFVNYGLRLVIVGDITRRVEHSKSLRDFVTEANRGNRIWFVTDRDELHDRLLSASGDSK